MEGRGWRTSGQGHLAFVVVLLLFASAAAGASNAATAEDLSLPKELPGGSTLVSTRDVFSEVASPPEAAELRAAMPQASGGIEYRYTAASGTGISSDWGVVVFSFPTQETALAAFRRLGASRGLLYKDPRETRRSVLDSSLAAERLSLARCEYACLIGEILVFANGETLVWIDDYTVDYTSADASALLTDSRYEQAALEAIAIADLICPEQSAGATYLPCSSTLPRGPLVASFEYKNRPWERTVAVFHLTNATCEYIYVPTDAIVVSGVTPIGPAEATLTSLDWPRKIIAAFDTIYKKVYRPINDVLAPLRILVDPVSELVKLARQVGPFLIETAGGIDTKAILLEAMAGVLSAKEHAALELFTSCFLYCDDPAETGRPPLWVNESCGALTGRRGELACRCAALCPAARLTAWRDYAAAWGLPKDRRLESAYVMPPQSELVLSVPYHHGVTLDTTKIALDICSYQALEPYGLCSATPDTAMVNTLCGIYSDHGGSGVEHNDEFPSYSLHFRPTAKTCSDLTLAEVSAAQQSPGGEVEISATIKNTGVANAEGCSTALYVDGQQVEERKTPALSHWKTWGCVFRWRGTAGRHTVVVEVDSNGGIPECDETNNALSTTIDVKMPSSPAGQKTPRSVTVLVIDISGSMDQQDETGKTKMEAAKVAALDFIRMFGDENKVKGGEHQLGVVTFSETVSRAVELTADAAKASDAVSGLQPETSTNLVDALTTANAMLDSAGADAKKIIVLLSDGRPNVSRTAQGEDACQQEVMLGPVAVAMLRGTCLYVVGLGTAGGTDTNLDESFLQEVAMATGCGHYYSATNATELHQVYMRARHESLGTLREAVTAEVSQGETVMVGTATVPANQDELHYTVDWPGSRLDPLLVDPQGQTVDQAYPGASIATYSTMAHVIVLNPQAGEWRMGAVGADVPEGTTQFQALLSTRGEVEMPSELLVLLGRVATFLLALLLAAVLAAVGVP